MARQTVLLLFGGESSEHDVSLVSARNVYAAMNSDKYDILLGYIDQTGKWWLLQEWPNDISQYDGTQLLAMPGAACFTTVPGNQAIYPSVILPVLHGKNGEDGTVQGLAALLHIPIVGCDMTASAVCMDKVLTKQVLEANGIKTVEHRIYRRGEPMLSYDDVASDLGVTLFVKPSRSGSSVGVSKVHDESEFVPAINKALEHDDKVLIERAVVGRELETAVLGNPPHHRVSNVGEIIPGAEFYDYEDKYSSSSASQVLVSTELDDTVRESIRETSRTAYAALGCSGLARVDYLLEGDQPYIIEVNTLPGFTNISMYPKLWEAVGMEYSSLIDELIALALQ